MVNTATYGWEPNVFGSNTPIIRDSNYSGSSINSSQAVYIIENSTMGFTHTQEQVQMTIRDSVINGDVVATGDSSITLIDTTVYGIGEADEAGKRAQGNVFVSGNATVTLINSTVEGQLSATDARKIVIE